MKANRDPKETQVSEAEREKLIAYLDGELDEAAEQQVVAELGVRPEMRREADSLKKTWELLDFLPKPAPPPQFTEQTMQKLQVTKLLLIKREQWWRRFAVIGWVATLVLVGLLGFAAAYFWPSRERFAGHDTKPQPTPSASEAKKPENMDGPGVREEQRLLLQMRLEIDRVMAELKNRTEPWEMAELQRKRRLGPLVFMEDLLKLATKYNVPLQRPLLPGAGPSVPREEEPPPIKNPKKELKKTMPTKPGEKGEASATNGD